VSVAVAIAFPCPPGSYGHIDALEAPAPVIGELLADPGLELGKFPGTFDKDLADRDDRQQALDRGFHEGRNRGIQIDLGNADAALNIRLAGVAANVVEEQLESALLDSEPECSREGAAAVLVHRIIDEQLGEKP
jgi:hypothetical protein